MNALPYEKQVQVISSLTEGCSRRATERLTGVHRDTIMRLGVRIGAGCGAVHDRLFRNLNVPLIELDEVWSYVGKKQRKLTVDDSSGKGDQYIYTALDTIHKAIITAYVGKRTLENTCAFAEDLRMRVINRPQISSDAFHAYPEAIERAFGSDVHYGHMALGVTDHIWSLEELIHAVRQPDDLPERVPPFTLIPGGLS
jgi:hypothetical protein